MAAKKQLVYPASTKLTDEEKALQERRGKYYRKLTTQACEMFMKEADTDKVGIMLSGGVDSTIVLWTLLELGIRPYVYTIHLRTDANLSTDAKKAKALAERYDLPFRLVKMPEDPDELARLIKQMSDDHPVIETRPDFEVAPVFYQIIKYARDNDGVHDMFSGIGDANIHHVGRSKEIRGRHDDLPISEADAQRAFQLGGYQDEMLIELSANLGVNLLLPLQLTAQMHPYYNVPWHVLNIPRLKAITIGAWAAEEEASGIMAKVGPLQNGDSGGRNYYDSKLRESAFAETFIERKVTSAQVYYNELLKRHRKREVDDREYWNWFAYVTAGRPLPDGYVAPADLRTGKALLPEPEVREHDVPDIFGGISDDEEYKLDENGELDRRTDCLGNAFFEGDDVALTSCPRAQAGLCSKWYPDAEYDLTQCELWSGWGQDNSDTLRRLADVTAGSASTAYREWADMVDKTLAKISQKHHHFS